MTAISTRRRYPKISLGKDGTWHAWVTVGTKPNGRPDQRHVNRRTEAEAEQRVDELLEQTRSNAVVVPGRAMTVASWLDLYLDTVAPRRCDPSTVTDYRSKCTHWVVPVIGRTRLDQLRPEQLDDVYLKMQRAGKADGSILKTHRILSRALEVAYRRSLVSRNVAKLIDSPTARPVEQSPLTQAEATAVLHAAAGRRGAARWSVALAMGLRQGEALGMRWSYVDFDRGELKVWWQLRRRAFVHGCGGACGRQRGGNCPQRHLPLRSGEHVLVDGYLLKEPKGKGRRMIPLPTELVEQLRAHRAGQQIDRVLADSLWTEHDLVFSTDRGAPIDPSDDYRMWKALLAAAGVRDARVHDARHTAATLLLAQGVDIRTVQEILGHSDVRVTQGYAHVSSDMARAAMQGMGASLLG
ncbi:tyrosine-type recombinase/integrase [Actinoplanes sp. NPDC051494]|uniref:tyrosine-type recombinase/integrase n=1 Tax=Actinoplanes sp. NPDC051494 TaxID=3363907 RepID=UPI0037A83E8C